MTDTELAPIIEWKRSQDLRTVNSFTYSEVADCLDRAADLIEKDGWCRASLFDGRKMCVRGGIWAASGGTGASENTLPRYRPLMTTAEEAVSYWLADQRGEAEGVHVPTWNDAECQSQEEAISVLRDTAAFVRSGDEEL